MTRLSVMMVEPKYGLNIGYVARTMMNFGISELIITGLERLPDDAYKFSAHARAVVENAILGDFKDEISRFDLRVGTTAKPSTSSKNIDRLAITPELAFRKARKFRSALLILGRDDSGLNNLELSSCDYLVTIPASKDYPTLNISHALAILLYLWRGTPPAAKRSYITAQERKVALEYAKDILDGIAISDERKKRAMKLLRGITMNYVTSEEDMVTLLGFLRRTKMALAGTTAQRANLFKTSDYRG